MKLKDLKKALYKLSKEELNQDVIVLHEYTSGPPKKIGKSKCNLYWTGDDDPSQLYTLAELKENDYDKEEIEGFIIEVERGQFVIDCR